MTTTTIPCPVEYVDADGDELIAAAPDLLTALRAVFPLVQGKADTGWCMHDRPEGASAMGLYALVAAAIAKAEGLQP